MSFLLCLKGECPADFVRERASRHSFPPAWSRSRTRRIEQRGRQRLLRRLPPASLAPASPDSPPAPAYRLTRETHWKQRKVRTCCVEWVLSLEIFADATRSTRTSLMLPHSTWILVASARRRQHAWHSCRAGCIIFLEKRGCEKHAGSTEL